MIVLTDYPKLKQIDANYRGMETEKLLEVRKTMFHSMMCSWSEEPVGGWVVNYDPKEIEKELDFRKVKREEL